MNVGKSEGGAGLSPDDAADSGFALDDAVRNAHLAAESGQVHHQLDGINIVGDHDQLSLLLLHKSSHLK